MSSQKQKGFLTTRHWASAFRWTDLNIDQVPMVMSFCSDLHFLCIGYEVISTSLSGRRKKRKPFRPKPDSKLFEY